MIKSVGFTKIGGIKIHEFKVGDYIEEIEDFGSQYVSFKEGNETKYIKQINNSPELALVEPKPKGKESECYPQYRNITSWPMANLTAQSKNLNKPLVRYEKKDKKKEKPIFIDGVESKERPGTINLTTFLEQKGINSKDQIIRPQIVYLGMNCSGKQEWKGGFYTEKQRHLFQWSNGFGDMANVVRNSPLSGGYFTDFIKCYKEADSNNVDVSTGLPNVDWFDVYLKIFVKELEWLRNTFPTGEDGSVEDPDSWNAYVIICGPRTNDVIANPRTYKFYEDGQRVKKDEKSSCDFISKLSEIYPKVKVLYFGLHYGKRSRSTLCFGRDTQKHDTAISKRLSSGRVYNDLEIMKYDRNTKDLEQYDFAIKIKKDGSVYLEDKTKSSST